MIAARRAWLAALAAASLPIVSFATIPAHAANVFMELACHVGHHPSSASLVVYGVDPAESLSYEAVGANGVRHTGTFSVPYYEPAHVSDFGGAISSGLTAPYLVTVTADGAVLLSEEAQTGHPDGTCERVGTLPVPAYPDFDGGEWGATHDNEFLAWHRSDSGELTVEIDRERGGRFEGVIPEAWRGVVEFGTAPKLPEGAVTFSGMDGSYSGFIDVIYTSTPGVSEPVEVYLAQSDGEWHRNGTILPGDRPGWYMFHSGEDEWCHNGGQGRLITFRAVHPETRTVLGERTYEQNCSEEDPTTTVLPFPAQPDVDDSGNWVVPEDTGTFQWRLLLDGTLQVQILAPWTTFTEGGATFNYGLPEAPVDPGPEPGPEVIRLDGGDRYETAAKLALQHYEPGLDTVYLATGRDFPDALAGAALAGGQSLPILLTRPDGLPGATRAALNDLRPGRVVVLGGDMVVTQKVLDELTSLGLPHDRIYGSDRYRTAAAVSALMDRSDVVVVATGLDYPDALAGSAAAGSVGAPVLLTRHKSLPGAAVTELLRHDPQRVLVLGGNMAVDSDVVTQIETLGYAVERVHGENRYGTAAALAALWSEGAEQAWVSTGVDYADALAASPLAARHDGPILLTRPTSLPSTTSQALLSLSPSTVHVLGGTEAVADAVLGEIRHLPWE